MLKTKKFVLLVTLFINDLIRILESLVVTLIFSDFNINKSLMAKPWSEKLTLAFLNKQSGLILILNF